MMMSRTSLRKSSCLVVLCLSFVVGCLSVTTSHAQTSTERKVELMEQALNARGTGDFRAAKNALDELAKLAPGDRKVARLLVEVERQLAIQPQMMEVPLDPAVLFLDEEAEAIARAETDRLRALLETTAKERKTARSLARKKQYDQAIEVLDEVSADLPNNLLTQETLREIDEDRGELLVDQARYLLKSGDLGAARVALDQRLDMGAFNHSVEKLTLSLERAEERAEKAIAAVQASAPRVSVSTGQSDLIAMMNRARRQYVAISGNTTVNVPSGFYQPIFSVRDISTKVTIWDGATLIMGGLTREEVKKVNDKIPVLGDIPLLGKLFRSKGESAQKRNLLIFVTANLLSPGGSPKKQNLRNVAPSALFQNPVLITPGGAEARNGD